MSGLLFLKTKSFVKIKGGNLEIIIIEKCEIARILKEI